jgi:hypothetical protein
MKKPNKAAKCWWCNRKLVSPAVFATVTTDTGDRLKVHKDCATKARAFWKPITAAVRRRPVYATRSA